MPTERIYGTSVGPNAIVWLIDQSNLTSIPLGALTNTGNANAIGRSAVLPGKIYIVENGTPQKVWILDPSNGNVTGPANIGGVPVTNSVRGAVDPITDRWFVTSNGDTNLYEIVGKDTATPSMVLIGPMGPIPAAPNGGDMVFDSTGTLYSTQTGYLYTVNTTTGAHTLVGQHFAGATPVVLNGVFFDADSNTFYGVAGATVYTMNPADASLTFAFTSPSGSLTDLASSGLASDFPPVVCPDFNDPGELTVTTSPIGGADVQASAPFLVKLVVNNVGSGPLQNTLAKFTVPAGFTLVAGSTTLNGTTVADISPAGIPVTSPRAATAGFTGVVFNGTQNKATVTFQLIRTAAPLTDTTFPLGNVTVSGSGYSPECASLVYNVPASVLVQGVIDLPPFTTASECDTTLVELCHHEAPVLVCIGGNPAYMHAAYDRNGAYIPPNSTQFTLPAGTTGPDGSNYYRTYFTRGNGVLNNVTAWVDGSCGGDYEYVRTGYYVCAAGVTLYREETTSWIGAVSLGSAVTFTGSNGATVAAPANYAIGQCVAATVDVEIVEHFVCAAGTTLVRQERTVSNGSTGVVTSSTVTFYGLNGAVVAAPATFTEGTCANVALDIESEQVCAGSVNLTRRRIYDTTTGNLVSETFTGSNGATVPTPAVYTQGECQTADIEIVHDLACAAGVQVVREQTFTNGVITATTWFGANGATIAAPAAFTFGNCPAVDTDIVERFVCAAGVTLVQRTVFINGVPSAPTYFGVNGAAVAVPAAFTEGPCDDQDLDIESEQVCAAGVTLTRRRVYDAETAVLVSETFIGANGATVATPAAYSQGACVLADIEIKHDLACAGGVQVLREQVWTNGVVTATTWTGANGAVIAAPVAFTWGPCVAGADTEIVERMVCAAGVTLIQRVIWTNGVAGAANYFGTNGAAVAAPAAFTEGPCDDQDIDIVSETVCAAGVTLTRRRIVDGETGVLISETFIGTNGATVATPAAYTQGQCFPAAIETTHDLACAGGVQVIREQTRTNGAVTATNWFGANGAAIAAPAAFTFGACPASDTEIVERFVCSANVTLVQRTVFTNGVAAAPTYFGLNGAAVAAPAAFTEGACDGSVDMENEYVCSAGVTLVRRRITNGTTGALVSETFITSNGAVVAAPATYTIGQCATGLQIESEVCQSLPGAAPTINYYDGLGGGTVPSIAPWGTAPSLTQSLTNGLQAPVPFANRADNYSARSRGYLIAPATGAFTFYLSSDDAGTFGLGPVNGPLGSYTNISNPGYSGAPGTGGSSFTVNLVAGQYYPYEMGYSEGAGGDYVQVDWSGPGIATRTLVPASAITSGPTNRKLVRRTIVAADGTATYTYTLPNGTVVVPTATSPIVECPAAPNSVGLYAVQKCGPTSNVKTTSTVQATRVALENDVIFTAACPTTSTVSNSILNVGVNAAVAGTGPIPANARGVTIYNVTGARITVNLASHGIVAIPANGTWSGNLPDNVPPYSGAWTVATVAGNSGPAVNGANPAVLIDWVARV